MLEIRHRDMQAQADTQEAYNEIYRGEGINQRDSFYLWLIGLLHPKPGRLLIDISCGQGRLSVLARQQGIKAMGIDFALDGVLFGRSAAPDCGWAVGDGEHLPLQESCADYITHIGSLEHYWSPSLGAQEIARLLKPDGKACILLPNAYGLFGNIRHVWATGEIFDDGQPLQRYATRRWWERLLTDGGLRVIRTLGYGEVDRPRTRQDALFLLRSPRKAFRLLVNQFVPINLMNQLVYICARA